MSLRDRLPLLRLNASPKTGLIPHFRMGSEIPKLIHQTYHNRDLPPEVVRNIAQLRLLNPGSPTDRRRQPFCSYLTAGVENGTLSDVVLHRVEK